MQRKLDTIQKKAKLNEVWTIGEPGEEAKAFKEEVMRYGV